MSSRTRAILWAQWRTLWNHLPRSNRFGLAFTLGMSALWYGAVVMLAVGAGVLLASPDQGATVAKLLPGALLLALLYWQVVPILLASTGASLDVKKLLAYPIPHRELFGLEVLLRTTTGVEVLMVFVGAFVGLLRNPRLPLWAPLALTVYAAFNLLLSVGIRDVVMRLFARKAIRELMVFLFVLLAALPQLLLVSGMGSRFKVLIPLTSSQFWPWIVTANLLQGHFTPTLGLVLCGWTAAAYWFGRWRFEGSLQVDAHESAAPVEPAGSGSGWWDRLYRLPAAIFPDPTAVMIEKELRVLSRSARFRLVFLMGFSFGLLIWLPMTFGGSGSPDSWVGRNYLALVCSYALLLLSDVLFWNAFGFDRTAAQLYFLAPVPTATVLFAKNFTAMIFITLDVAMVVLVCTLFRLPVSAGKVLEAYLIVFTVSLFLMAVGNLSSTYNPKPMDPAKSFRSNSGRQMQAVMMLLFPVTLTPALLAYLARYAFEVEWAFHAVLLFFAILGFLVRRIAVESAVQVLERRKEAIVTSLSQSDGPISG